MVEEQKALLTEKINKCTSFKDPERYPLEFHCPPISAEISMWWNFRLWLIEIITHAWVRLADSIIILECDERENACLTEILYCFYQS